MNFGKIGSYCKHRPVLSLRSDIIILLLGLLRSCKMRFYDGGICRPRGVRLSRDRARTSSDQETGCNEAPPNICESPKVPKGDAHTFAPARRPSPKSMSVLGPMLECFALFQL